MSSLRLQQNHFSATGRQRRLVQVRECSSPVIAIATAAKAATRRSPLSPSNATPRPRQDPRDRTASRAAGRRPSSAITATSVAPPAGSRRSRAARRHMTALDREHTRAPACPSPTSSRRRSGSRPPAARSSPRDDPHEVPDHALDRPPVVSRRDSTWNGPLGAAHPVPPAPITNPTTGDPAPPATPAGAAATGAMQPPELRHDRRARARRRRRPSPRFLRARPAPTRRTRPTPGRTAGT